AVARAEREQEALAPELTAPGFAQRQRRIPGVVGIPADPADIDHDEVLAARERGERAEPQAQPAVVDLRHGVDDRADPRLERRRDERLRVAMAGAGAPAADQREPHGLTRLRNAVERRAIMAEMARIVAEKKRRICAQPLIAPDQVAQR